MIDTRFFLDNPLLRDYIRQKWSEIMANNGTLSDTTVQMLVAELDKKIEAAQQDIAKYQQAVAVQQQSDTDGLFVKT